MGVSLLRYMFSVTLGSVVVFEGSSRLYLRVLNVLLGCVRPFFRGPFELGENQLVLAKIFFFSCLTASLRF